MLIEKLLSFALSIPAVQKLNIAGATLDNAVTALSAINFLGNFINLGAAIRNTVIIIVAALACGLIKLLLSFIP